MIPTEANDFYLFRGVITRQFSKKKNRKLDLNLERYKITGA